MKQIKNIAVFCASSTELDEKYVNNALDLAEFMIEKNMGLVFGGANVGLMKVVAERIFAAGLPVTGIIPQFFVNRGLASECSSSIIITATMHERKEKLISLGDAFVVLPGGFGTLDELLEVITLNQIGQIDKKVVIFDEVNFYDDLLKQFEFIYKERFATSDEKFYEVARNVEELKKVFL